MLTRAYSACILANIAFLYQGQQQILRFGGVSLLVRLIAHREDRKVVLHCVAALQNLTYKNSDCCFELLEQGVQASTTDYPLPPTHTHPPTQTHLTALALGARG